MKTFVLKGKINEVIAQINFIKTLCQIKGIKPTVANYLALIGGKE